jgi:site-specific DNA-methyltransferase (adenine-specific)
VSESFLNGKIELHCGDCRDVLATLAENSFNACVTDPPYHLTSGKNGGSGVASVNLESPYGRSRIGTGNGSGGFMGKAWDGGDIAFQVATWLYVWRVMKPGAHLVAFSGTRTYHRLACAIEDAGFEIRDQIGWAFGTGFPKSHNIGDGWGTALKPAWEPVVLARKPLSEKTVAANVLKWGTGAINIDGCRVEHVTVNGGNLADNPHLRSSKGSHDEVAADGFVNNHGFRPNQSGRWPANIIHDGSKEVVAGFPVVGDSHPPDNEGSIRSNRIFGKDERPRGFHPGFADGGSAARFFYTAKADSDDRIGSKHPTVKPIDLMQYLVRLVTPPQGTVLDPFSGTGTTGEAAWREGFSAVLIECEAEYQNDIRRRMVLARSGPTERGAESGKAKMAGKPLDPGPLWSHKLP